MCKSFVWSFVPPPASTFFFAWYFCPRVFLGHWYYLPKRHLKESASFAGKVCTRFHTVQQERGDNAEKEGTNEKTSQYCRLLLRHPLVIILFPSSHRHIKRKRRKEYTRRQATYKQPRTNDKDKKSSIVLLVFFLPDTCQRLWTD